MYISVAKPDTVRRLRKSEGTALDEEIPSSSTDAGILSVRFLDRDSRKVSVVGAVDNMPSGQ
jgi:hypothetical protein